MTPRHREVIERMKAAAGDAALPEAAPYSQRPSGAALLLSDGGLIRGTRVESASFPLAIPAVQNAVTTALALGRRDFVALAVSTDSIQPLDMIYLGAFLPDAVQQGATLVARSAANLTNDVHEAQVRLPLPAASRDGADQTADRIALARAAAANAHVPESDFPVGCIGVVGDMYVPGVNVEHPEWTMTLCAERNMIGTLVSYGLGAPEEIYVTCIHDPNGSPCGACRQVLAEQTPGVPVWLDRGTEPHVVYTPEFLLPASFTGTALRR